MKIGYAKLGRSMPLTLAKCGNLGGDVEMVAVVKDLALRHPEHDFFLVGRNTGEHPKDVGLPRNVYNPWMTWGSELRRRFNEAGFNHPNLSTDEQLVLRDIFAEVTLPTLRDMDQFIIWVGQHGTSNSPIPRVDDRTQLTKPQDWCSYYCSYLFQGINAWRDVDPLNREEVYLNADARNRHKMRDLKWPLRHPVLAQFNFVNNLKHERYGDDDRLLEEFTASKRHGITGGPVWTTTVDNVYARLEINGLAPGMPFGDLISYDETHDTRRAFGLFINEARAIGVRPELARKNILRDWVLPLHPAFIHGTWSKDSLAELQTSIEPAPWELYYPKLHSVLATLTTPSSGSGWATAKPWEAFAAGTVCFFHPEYDTQDNILGDAPAWLRQWLRVKTPRELALRIGALHADPQTWLTIVRAQRQHFDAALQEKRYLRVIEERIGL